MENSHNKKGVILLLVAIIVILITLFTLLATGTISFKSNEIDNNDYNENINDNSTTTDNNTIQTKLVDNLGCNDSQTNFNGISVKLEQKSEDMMCDISSFTINGKDIKDDVLMWVYSYEIYDNNVIILSGSTSGTLLTIYSLNHDSAIMKLSPDNLSGYWVKSYITNNRKIIINGEECGEQCGTSTGYPKATFEMEYYNNSFSFSKLVDRQSS